MTHPAPSLPSPDALEALPLPVFALDGRYHLEPLNGAAMALMESGRVFTRSVLAAEEPEGLRERPLHVAGA